MCFVEGSCTSNFEETHTYYLTKAPSELVTTAPTVYSVYVFFSCFFVTSLGREVVPMDAQLMRLGIYFLLFIGVFISASGYPFSHGSIVYTWEQLLALCNTKVLPDQKTKDLCGIKSCVFCLLSTALERSACQMTIM